MGAIRGLFRMLDAGGRAIRGLVRACAWFLAAGALLVLVTGAPDAALIVGATAAVLFWLSVPGNFADLAAGRIGLPRLGPRNRASREIAERGLRLGDKQNPAGRRAGDWGLLAGDYQEHVLIGGAPGSGKSTFLVNAASAANEILAPTEGGRVGVVVLDMKGDPGLPAALAADAWFSLGAGDSMGWNPFSAGDAASWRDVMLSAYEWTEPHYRDAAARYLGAALAALEATSERSGEVSFAEAVRYVENPEELTGRVAELRQRDEPGRADALASALRMLDPKTGDRSLRSGVLGMGNRLATLLHSPAVAGRLDPDPESIEQVDLDDALEWGRRIVISLPAATYPAEAPALAGAVIATLSARAQATAAGGTQELRCVLFVDEAAQLTGSQLRRAVAIGRGAGVGVVFATQDLSDLDQVAPGTLAAVKSGCATWVVFRQVASADEIARDIGTYTTTKATRQRERGLIFDRYTGAESEREVEEFSYHPNAIRQLARGQAIAVMRSSAWRAPWHSYVLTDPSQPPPPRYAEPGSPTRAVAQLDRSAARKAAFEAEQAGLG